MDRTASDIMISEFPFVDCDVTVAEAEACFEQGALGALPVLNPDRTVFGLLVPKHFAAFYRRSLNNPLAIHAWEICDARPLLCSPSDDLHGVAAALLSSDTRHVLVVNEARQLVGLISIEMLLERELADAGQKGVAGATTAPRSR